MPFLSKLSSLFSGKSEMAEQVPSKSLENIEYNGFFITPAPIPEGGQFRLSAKITKIIDGVEQTHSFIRSDVIANRDDCIDMTIRKTKIAIAQLGNDIFN